MRGVPGTPQPLCLTHSPLSGCIFAETLELSFTWFPGLSLLWVSLGFLGMRASFCFPEYSKLPAAGWSCTPYSLCLESPCLPSQPSHPAQEPFLLGKLPLTTRTRAHPPPMHSSCTFFTAQQLQFYICLLFKAFLLYCKFQDHGIPHVRITWGSAWQVADPHGFGFFPI